MAKKRTTFGKLQRERDKQQKQMAKRDRRINRDDTVEAADEEPVVEYDEAQTLAALAALHEAYDDGRMSLEDFEARRDELRERLVQ